MLHYWTVLPFIGLLLCIALLPILAEHFWHSNARKGLVVLCFSLPMLGYLPFHEHGLDLLGHAMVEYCEFIIPLGALFVISGGIVVRGHPRPTPLTNTLFIAAGAVLASFIGTTGASMLLIRPLLRINRTRTHHVHVPVFYIFAVSNTGGLLTPLGDPPLLMGFVRGVDFFWTLSSWPIWLTVNGLILAVFFVWDWRIDRRTELGRAEPREGPDFHPGDKNGGIRLAGAWNFALMAGIMGAIIAQSSFLPRPWSSLAMIVLAVLSLTLTPQELRRENHFSWEAILEVAVLFVGIFITMIAPLSILEVHGREFGISEPWQYFWLTGGLSAVLDNAPTYLTFATIAAGSTKLHGLMIEQPLILSAISCGAVFMGAMTYIGNAPNFMVKAMADHAGCKMPSFFGYVGYSGMVLLPIFAVVPFFW